MQLRRLSIAILVAAVAGWLAVNSGVGAQVRSNDPNIAMMDDCDPADPAYDALGGCPEGAPPGSQSHRGDVPLMELFALLTSPLAPGHVIGHPSWRNEPPYVSVRSGQTVRVSNRGGRVHTFTRVENFGGGFVPLLNEQMTPALECGANFQPNPAVTFIGVGETERVSGLAPGLHTFQCCIHPWMRAAVRVN
jgi:plastocyanin